MPMSFEQDGDDGARTIVQVKDRAVKVVQLDQRLTYAWLIEGAPSTRFSESILAPLREAARSRGTYLVEPPRRDFLRAPHDMDDLQLPWGRFELLPAISVKMALRSHAPVQDRKKDYSFLEVFFFQEEFAPPLDDLVAAALRSLEWARHASDEIL